MSLILKCLSLGIIYFFLTGLFKKPSFTLERNFKPTPNEDPYKKLIYIVLDALRFDYTIENNNHNFIHNKMKNYYEILRKNNSFHALSVCGIPTSTTCRITGLLTGSPSNFLEGTKTFLNSKILIDNLIEQVHKKMKVSFYGDGTWLSLFPYLSKNSETFDPYTKLNLIKEEKRVMKEMIKEMEKCNGDEFNKDNGCNNNGSNTKDTTNPKDGNTEPATNSNSDLNNNSSIFCHLITLDSFGHAFSLNHKIIEETLIRFDNFIKEVYDKMDDSTLLLITSDHGVTDEGAHGGVTKEEMSSVVSFISKKNLKINNIPNEIIKLRNKFISKCYDVQENSNIIHQDDILPTICYLMNLPIPSNSYGNFIHELVGNKEAYKEFLELKLKGMGEDGDKNIFNKNEDIKFPESINKNEIVNKNEDIKSVESINNNEIGNKNEDNKTNPHLFPLIISHYELSQKIYQNVTGNDKFKLIICLGLTFILIILLIFKISIFTKKSLILFFLIFNLSFSVQSVINEDLYWLGCFLLFNPTKINLLSSIFYLIIDTKFGIYNELIAQIKQKLHFESYIKDGNKLIMMMIVYYVIIIRRRVTKGNGGSNKDNDDIKDDNKEVDREIEGSNKDNDDIKNDGAYKDDIKEDNMDDKEDNKDNNKDDNSNIKDIKEVDRKVMNINKGNIKASQSSSSPTTSQSSSTPSIFIFFILFKYFFPSFFTVNFNFSLFSSFLSMDILCLIVFRPLESFFILIISNHLQFTYDFISFYILLNLSVGYSGLIKQIQSINYDIFYIFSSNPKWYEVIIPILVYFVYPRYLIISKMSKIDINNYLIFDILNLLITLSSTYYFFDSMNFYFHFASRCFFVCLYFVIDLILICIRNKIRGVLK